MMMLMNKKMESKEAIAVYVRERKRETERETKRDTGV